MYKFSDDYVTPVVLTEQFRQERIQQNKVKLLYGWEKFQRSGCSFIMEIIGLKNKEVCHKYFLYV